MSLEATWAVYAYLVDTWTDITQYVLHKYAISASWGHTSSDHNDRIAKAGSMSFLLDNATRVFDPGNSACLAGWGKGTKVYIQFTYDGRTYRRFKGMVETIVLNDPSELEHTVTVTVLDWMQYAYEFPLITPSIQTDKTGDVAITTILSGMDIQPDATDLDTGVNTFDALFDTVTKTTKAASEFNKVALSEDGYVYLKHDKTNAETLVFENATARNGTRTPIIIPTASVDNGFIIREDNGYLLKEDGGRIIPDMASAVDMVDEMRSHERRYGDNVINNVKITAYPKSVDTSESVLFKLDSPMRLSAGETKKFKGKYVNATSKKACNAISNTMVAPVATTDYLMNSQKNGSGTNLTADLTVSVVYGTEAPEYTLTNGSAVTAWVTKLQARGYGVYQDNEIEYILADDVSQAAYGVKELNIEQQYQRDTAAGASLAARILMNEKSPNTKLKRVTYTANKLGQNMMAFLCVDIGDMVNITNADLQIDQQYYVQGISFSLQHPVIEYSWILQEVETYTNVELEFPNLASAAFNTPSEMVNNAERTVIFSVKGSGVAGADGYGFIGFGEIDDSAGLIDQGWWILTQGITAGRELTFCRNYSTTDMVFARKIATPGVMANNTWIRMAVTFDNTTNAPKFYINGSDASSGYEFTSTPAGTVSDETGFKLYMCVNRVHGQTVNIKQVCVYDRILTASEIASDYATPCTVTDGLVFVGPSVNDRYLTDYENKSLTESDYVIDKIGYTVGIPIAGGLEGPPICRLI